MPSSHPSPLPSPPLLPGPTPAYATPLGAAYLGDSLELLERLPDASVNLIMTSPPFALLRQKEYGNRDEDGYTLWLAQFGEVALRKLRPDGSLVLDLGGAYRRGVPVRSLYQFRVLLHFCDVLGFHLAEEFYWHNPSKLPSPIEWVNKRKLRAKDSVNTLWWLSRSEWPKADVSRVLTEYSGRMKRLLRDPEAYYSPAERPSGHNIGSAFGRDNGGAIPSNLLQIPNSEAGGRYLGACKRLGVKAHPARYPARLPEFFVRFLTDPGDLVVDLFGGSNTTGFVAESEGRRWLTFEQEPQYLAASAFRFMPERASLSALERVYRRILDGQTASAADLCGDTPPLLSAP